MYGSIVHHLYIALFFCFLLLFVYSIFSEGENLNHTGERCPLQKPRKAGPSLVGLWVPRPVWGVACGHCSGSDSRVGERCLLGPLPRPPTAVPSSTVRADSLEVGLPLLKCPRTQRGLGHQLRAPRLIFFPQCGGQYEDGTAAAYDDSD